MDLSPDITPEDLEVFLQEADEQIELLDEEIVRLEREEDTAPLLQEIFRAAHSLKGPAGMIGHHQMANLAHSMENILDQLRLGTTGVSTPIVDALLVGLDLLRALKDDLSNGTDSQIEISDAVSVLDSLAHAGEWQVPGSASPDEGQAKLHLDREHEEQVRSSLDAGAHAYLLQANISLASGWVGIRCFQLLDALSQLSEIIISIPSLADIENNKESNLVQVVMTTDQDVETIQKIVSEIEDIEDLEMTPIDPDDPESDAWQGLVSDVPNQLLSGAPDTPDDTEDGGGKELAVVGAPVENTGAEQPAVSEGGGNGQVRSQQTQTVRVDVERLDNLMTTIGELVIDRTRIAQIGRLLQAKYKDDELVQALGETSAHVAKVVDDLQNEIMEVRMMPIGTVFNGFPRMVRDLAQRFGKEVEFVVEGQDTEIDRTVVERIRDPLLHLLRNSIDHGIETPDVRTAAGKPARGTITLSANQEQGSIVIRVAGDGTGIDPNELRATAAKKGMLSQEAADRLSDSEAIDLIFAPGASTAAATTEVSGRGVGMDIVKTNIESIELLSKPVEIPFRANGGSVRRSR
ncbi:MAG: chemotaxis protein CheA, partial [Chloroflexi bacterium]|nr:chemotaxis protein CheA [Chloroflexota bacterium]